MRRGFRLVAAAGLAGVVVWGASAAAVASQGASLKLAPPGWADGGDPNVPADQVAADKSHARADCADNALLLFRVRGSAEQPGSDKLGGWTAAAGEAAIARGWRVRDMQADYPAPALPIVQLAAELAAAVVAKSPTAVVAAVTTIKDYRDVASKSWRSVRDQLVAAHGRCAKRTILVAGYSYGGIVLRYVVRNLPESERAKIKRIDLIADPTAQGSIDAKMRHSGGYSARRTAAGLDTWSALRNPVFKQAHYPDDIVKRAVQYCVPYDLICDTNPVNFAAFASGGASRHTSYDWQRIGTAAGEGLRTFTNSARWRQLGLADRLAARPTDFLTGLSCTGPRFCMFTEYSGRTFIWNGSSWSARSRIGGMQHVQGVSCTSDRFCVAIGASAVNRHKDRLGNTRWRFLNYAASWNGKRWNKSIRLFSYSGMESYFDVQSISCISSSFCMVIAGQVGSLVWNGRLWLTHPGGASGTDGQGVVGCASSRFCLGIADNFVNYWNGTTWRWKPHESRTRLTTIPGLNGFIDSLECVSPRFCVGVGGGPAAYMWNGRRWSRSKPFSSAVQVRSVSCPSPSSCAAADADGAVSFWDGSAWSSAVQVTPDGSGALVSCWRQRACMLVSGTGQAAVYG